MAQAKCNNDDCSKEPWMLRKPLDEYKRGPTCPECGTTNVEINTPGAPAATAVDSDANPGGQHGESGAVEQTQAVQPADAADGEQSAAPAVPANTDAIQTGMQAGQMLAEMGGGSPEEKAQAEGALFQTVGSMVASFGERMAKDKLQGIQRAKEADQSDISTKDDYVECPECSGQLTNLPAPGAEFTCPHCGAHLEA